MLLVKITAAVQQNMQPKALFYYLQRVNNNNNNYGFQGFRRHRD